MAGRTGPEADAADRGAVRSAFHLHAAADLKDGATPLLRPLRKRVEFLRVARAGRKAVSAGLVLQAAPHPGPADEPDAIGFGLTASRKVGKAVARNRARRRLRALARQHLPRHGRQGMDYVLIARAAAVNRPFAMLEQDLLSALRRVGADRAKGGTS